MSAPTEFSRVFPRLIAAYQTGRLVPFIGSGMSRPLCADWATMITQLEKAACCTEPEKLTPDTPRDELVRRANKAVRTLKRRKPGTFAKGVRAALLSAGAASRPLPASTVALARMSWPLVLTTNYDGCYAAAYLAAESERELAVVGRSAEDCQRVLNSLTTPGRSLLWALQGYLGDLPPQPAAARAVPSRGLEEQLIVGHEEYRRVTYRELDFRRAFAEVFRQRSLLFLGAGIQETYLQELFGEVLEFYGPATRPHYAFINEGEVDPEFMLARFQIVVVEYPKNQHEEVTKRLKCLADEVYRPARASVSWSWGRIAGKRRNNWTSVADFEVVRGPLPSTRLEHECLVVSAGGSDASFFFSPGIRTVMRDWGAEHVRATDDPYLGELSERHVYAVRARSPRDERSLAHIYEGSLALFRYLAGRYRTLRMQLIATGGADKVSPTAWQVRSYPPRFSFIQTTRAWAAWRKENPASDCRLVLHVMIESVYYDIASGRIDVLELLSCPDMRYFVELVSDTGELERRLFQTMPDFTLRELVQSLQLTPSAWEFEVTPPPVVGLGSRRLSSGRLAQSVQQCGVVPGSTIHFRRPP